MVSAVCGFMCVAIRNIVNVMGPNIIKFRCRKVLYKYYSFNWDFVDGFGLRYGRKQKKVGYLPRDCRKQIARFTQKFRVRGRKPKNQKISRFVPRHMRNCYPIVLHLYQKNEDDISCGTYMLCTDLIKIVFVLYIKLDFFPYILDCDQMLLSYCSSGSEIQSAKRFT